MECDNPSALSSSGELVTLCDKKRVKYVLLGQSLQRCAGVDNDAGQGSCVKQVVADDLQNDDIRCGSQKRCFKELRLTLDSHLVANLVYTFKNSKKFCKGFLCYAKGHGTMTKLSTVKVKLSDLASVTGSSQLMIVRLLHDGRQWLQPKWCYRVGGVLLRHVLMTEAMNWLSTLGGGYSALGDYHNHHARVAGELSLQQLRLAMQMGDAQTVIRCHLFLALSLMQQGRLRTAETIIRQQYQAVSRLSGGQDQLIAVCRGVWSRLNYLHCCRRRLQNGRHGNES